jgi:hypothetical protein
MRDIEHIIVHRYKRADSFAELDRRHRRTGMLRVGYHFGIDEDGVIHTGRPVDWAGCFSRRFDRTGLGIVLVGPNDTDEQAVSLSLLLRKLQGTYPLVPVRLPECSLCERQGNEQLDVSEDDRTEPPEE